MASIQGNQMLPQIKSIWIDEDQEAEKLYGMAGQTLLLDESDMESDNEEFDVTVLNSDKPVLNHKKKLCCHLWCQDRQHTTVITK